MASISNQNACSSAACRRGPTFATPRCGRLPSARSMRRAHSEQRTYIRAMLSLEPHHPSTADYRYLNCPKSLPVKSRTRLLSRRVQGFAQPLILVIFTRSIPLFVNPIFLAAAGERSILLPRVTGPRSLILTSTERPF